MSDYFMGIPVPDGWSIISHPSKGTRTLKEGSHSRGGYSAIEVRNRLVCHHKMQKEADNGQHRPANQETRSITPAQPASGNAGGAAAQPSPGPSVAHFALYSGQAACSTNTHHPYHSKPGQGASQGAGLAQQLPTAAQTRNAQIARSQAQAFLQAQAHQSLLSALTGALSTSSPLPHNPPEFGEIIGHRAWIAKNGVLHSVSMDTAWHPGITIHDYFGDKQHITDHNHAGIWAFKDPYDLGGEFTMHTIPSYSNLCFGTIWMWGTVIEHERGYRSQFASVRSLEKAWPGVGLEALRRAYKVKETGL